MHKKFEFLLSHAHYLVKQIKHILRNAKKNNLFPGCTQTGFPFTWFKFSDFYLINIVSNLFHKMSWKLSRKKKKIIVLKECN